MATPGVGLGMGDADGHGDVQGRVGEFELAQELPLVVVGGVGQIAAIAAELFDAQDPAPCLFVGQLDPAPASGGQEQRVGLVGQHLPGVDGQARGRRPAVRSDDRAGEQQRG
jgi:hypothetical protein